MSYKCSLHARSNVLVHTVSHMLAIIIHEMFFAAKGLSLHDLTQPRKQFPDKLLAKLQTTTFANRYQEVLKLKWN